MSGLVSKRKIKDRILTNEKPELVESLKHDILMLKVEIERLKRGYSSEEAKHVKKTDLEL